MSPAEGHHALRVLSSLNQQRAAGSFCDAVLNVGGGVVFPAHRNILACFSRLFEPDEASVSPTPPCTELRLQECPTHGLELLLDFVYTGQLKLQHENLQQVEHAAVSLGVAEALAMCQRFKENSGQVKRKRGRPKKSTSDTTAPQGPVKEETLPSCTRDGSGCETPTTAASTTTRSGRVVKGPRRLAPDEDPPADSTGPGRDETGEDGAADGERGGAEKTNTDETTGETEVQQLNRATNLGAVSRLMAAVEEDEEEVGELEGVAEDTDEEYVPVPEPCSSSAGPSSAARRRRTPTKTVKDENGEAAEEEKDPKKNSVQCPICDKSFKSKYYLKVHNRRHTGERPFGCVKCGKRYFRKENLMLHESRDCTRAKSHTCLTCSAAFSGKDELRLHVFTHTGDMPHKCSTCSEQFTYKKNLTLHMMKVHGHPKPHACPQCPKTFLTRTELRVHEAAKHRGEKPFVCEECGHRASSRNGLQMHIKAIHRNERPFVCNFCGHAFSQKNNLNMHMRIHSGERPYQCHLCGKTFRTQASLDKHNRTHTGERPFGCDVCEQRFTEKGALVRHKASKHEEGRPHCCHICGKTFKAREQLRVHLRRHKGMRKFECIDCGYKFTRQAHLRRHIQIHKRTENYNPRQRKLRNVVVQDVEGSSGENDAPESVGAALIAEVSDYVPGAEDARESTSRVRAEVEEDDGDDGGGGGGSTGLSSGCIVRVVIETGGEVMEEVVSNQSQSFTVTDVPQLVPETYESTMDMEGIMENLEGKS